MHVDRRLLGWGAFLILAGAIPLAVRAGAISAESLAGWPTLWPLLLVGAGLGLILRRTPLHLLGGTISVLTAGVMVGGLLAAGFHGFPAFGACGANGNGSAFPEQTGTFGSNAAMHVEFNCGHLNIDSEDGADWRFSGTGPSERRPEVRVDADSVAITPPHEDFGFNDPASRWNVTIPRDPGISLSVTLNAGDGTADLHGASVDSFDLTMNAGSFTADLGTAARLDGLSATINAGSAAVSLPATSTSASMTVNAGSMKLCVPANVGLRISWGGALASNNFDSLGLVRLDDNHWESSGVASQRIDISATANAGSFTLVIGGSCHA
jgi:hypothetical protein